MTDGPGLRVACIGAGYFSQYHYGSWSRMGGVCLVGACDRDPVRAQATGLPAFSDLRVMVETQRPDLLDVILPPSTHASTLRMALSLGIKWIICQKPFCRDLGEARQIARDAEAAGATIIVHENFRFQPWYRTIRTALDRGEIGQVHQLTFRLRPGDGQGPEAYLSRQPYFRGMERFLVHETAVHWVDTFRYLLGDPMSVYADLRRINPAIAGEDAGHILFEHPGGVRALLDGNRHLDHETDNLRRTMGEALVEGTEGTISLRGDGSVSLRRFGRTEPVQILPPDTWDGFGGDCVHALQGHVVSGIRNGTPFENTAREYLEVIRIENAIYASAEQGCRVSL